METTIQALLVISLFAAVQERAIEFFRGMMLDGAIGKRFAGSARWKRFVDVLTICHWNIVPGIVLAVATHADALALFHSDGKNSAFFSLYLNVSPLGWSGDAIRSAVGGWPLSVSAHLMGCVLMGFAAGLGSKFWHDFAYGLMDLRARIRSLPDDAAKAQPQPQPAPAKISISQH